MSRSNRPDNFNYWHTTAFFSFSGLIFFDSKDFYTILLGSHLSSANFNASKKKSSNIQQIQTDVSGWTIELQRLWLQSQNSSYTEFQLQSSLALGFSPRSFSSRHWTFLPIFILIFHRLISWILLWRLFLSNGPLIDWFQLLFLSKYSSQGRLSGIRTLPRRPTIGTRSRRSNSKWRRR